MCPGRSVVREGVSDGPHSPASAALMLGQKSWLVSHTWPGCENVSWWGAGAAGEPQ